MLVHEKYLESFGQFYSWRISAMPGPWAALGEVVPLVEPVGILFITSYNDQGKQSLRWHRSRKIYNSLPETVAIKRAFLLS